MTTMWTHTDLTQFDDAQEVRIAGMRPDGSLRTPVIVWVVRVEGDLFTRSVNGPNAAWFRGVQTHHRGQILAGDKHIDVDFLRDDGVDEDQVDASYARKYGRYPGPVQSITSPTARSTTLKLIPHQHD